MPVLGNQGKAEIPTFQGHPLRFRKRNCGFRLNSRSLKHRHHPLIEYQRPPKLKPHLQLLFRLHSVLQAKVFALNLEWPPAADNTWGCLEITNMPLVFTGPEAFVVPVFTITNLPHLFLILEEGHLKSTNKFWF